MKNKLVTYAFIPALSLSLLGAGVASAHGMFNVSPEEVAIRQETMFKHEAHILGITVDEVKNAWAEGKSPQKIAKEKGISQKQMQARLNEVAEQKTTEQLNALVSKGTISQAQADKRLKIMTERISQSKGRSKGFHKSFRF